MKRRGLPFGFVYLRLLLTLVVVPTVVLFFHFFLGPSPGAAARNVVSVMVTGGAITWLLVGTAAVVVVWYLQPLFAVAARHAAADTVPPETANAAVGRLNALPGLLFFVSFATFGLGAAYELFTGHDRGAAAFGSGWLVAEAAVSAFMTATLLSLHFDTHLFALKRRLMLCRPTAALRYSSFYAKLFLVLTAMVLFLFFQSFGTIASFVVIGNRMGTGLPDLPRGVEFLRPDAVFGRTMQNDGMAAAIGVVLVRGAVFLVLTTDTLILIRSLIRAPLSIVRRSLAGLALESQAVDLPGIDIVNNDEFGPVFQQINMLIARQQGELVASRARFHEVVRSAPDPILAFSADGGVLLANPAAERLFGYSPDQLKTLRIDTCLRLPPAESATAIEYPSTGRSPRRAGDGGDVATAGAFSQYLAAGESGPLRVVGITANAETIPLEVNASRTDTPTGAVYTLVIRDIRKQVEFESSLSDARTAAERANRQKSEFLANMSHELRTPLNAILGFAQLLENDRNLTPGQREKLAIISRSGEHLLGLINDILDISKIEAGKLEMHTEVFDLPQLLYDVREMFALRAESKGLALDLELLGDLPRYVEGDLGKLRQVLINLLGNSIKFTQSGGVGLVVGSDDSGGRAGTVRFRVRDTGRGIPADEIAAIVEPFGQSSLNRNDGGTGLGLAISARFVAMMGGELRIDSVVGEGTSVSFAANLPPAASEPAAERVVRHVTAIKGGLHPRVLIVDDKLPNRLVLKEMLEQVGFSVMEAENGAEAVDRFTAHRPDIVFMDIKMPVMDGYEAAAAIARTNERAVPLFALTASAFTHDEQRIRAAGFTGYLSKPFQQAGIFALLQEHTALEFETAAGPETDVAPAVRRPVDLDYGALGRLLTAAWVERFEESVMINDFAAVQRLSRELIDELSGDAAAGAGVAVASAAAAASSAAPGSAAVSPVAGLAAFLGDRAAAFDETALSAVVNGLKTGAADA